MTCPKCYAEFERNAGACPECGVTLVRNISGVMKTSSVMIAAGDKQTFYRSVQEVPEPMRSRLIETTHSANSGTIVIADRAGKEQLTQVIARREQVRVGHPKDAKNLKPGQPPSRDASESSAPHFMGGSFAGVNWVVWAGVLLSLAAAGVIASVFVVHW